MAVSRPWGFPDLHNRVPPHQTGMLSKDLRIFYLLEQHTLRVIENNHMQT